MKIHDLIFSEKITFRISRHLLFWILRYISLYLWFLSVSYVAPDPENLNKLSLSPAVLVPYLLIDAVFCYSVVYWLLPHFLLKTRYQLFGYILSVLIIITFIIKLQYTLRIYSEANLPAENSYITFWLQGVYFINGGPHVICGLFIAFKMLKTWFIKEEEKVSIARANADAELQLLKAQVHPHFLFNTLNNIYSFTLSKKPLAAALVLKLTDTLKYMINECEAPLVPLEKELKMIEDYIGLEKVRYSDRLNMHMEITGDYRDKLIAPLLLIPFVENSFKHGTSQMLEHPWIKLHIAILENTLDFRLSNSKPVSLDSVNGRRGIGLNNVQKRLQLLYPGGYILEIDERPDSYDIRLRIPLMKIAESPNTELTAEPLFTEAK